MRIVEILIAVNALCGIAAFVIARGIWKKVRGKMLPPPDDRKELGP